MEILRSISHRVERIVRPKRKKVSYTMNRVGMFSKAETNIKIEAIHFHGTSLETAAEKALPDGTRVAFHDIFRKRLVVATKAGAMTIDLAGRLADQERTIDHTLAAFQQNGVLSPLEDKDKIPDEGDETDD